MPHCNTDPLAAVSQPDEARKLGTETFLPVDTRLLMGDPFPAQPAGRRAAASIQGEHIGLLASTLRTSNGLERSNYSAVIESRLGFAKDLLSF
jgi:hypothetical protein